MLNSMGVPARPRSQAFALQGSYGNEDSYDEAALHDDDLQLGRRACPCAQPPGGGGSGRCCTASCCIDTRSICAQRAHLLKHLVKPLQLLLHLCLLRCCPVRPRPRATGSCARWLRDPTGPGRHRRWRAGWPLTRWRLLARAGCALCLCALLAALRARKLIPSAGQPLQAAAERRCFARPAAAPAPAVVARLRKQPRELLAARRTTPHAAARQAAPRHAAACHAAPRHAAPRPGGAARPEAVRRETASAAAAPAAPAAAAVPPAAAAVCRRPRVRVVIIVEADGGCSACCLDRLLLAQPGDLRADVAQDGVAAIGRIKLQVQELSEQRVGALFRCQIISAFACMLNADGDWMINALSHSHASRQGRPRPRQGRSDNLLWKQRR